MAEPKEAKLHEDGNVPFNLPGEAILGHAYFLF
jgi:hypothetical protein